MFIRLCAILLPLLFLACNIIAQDTSGIAKPRLVNSYADNVSSKAGKLDQRLDRYTDKALSKVQKLDAKIKRKLEKIDSIKSAKVFATSEQQYKRLQERLEKSTTLQHYIPKLDTLSTSIKFLQENQKLIGATKDGQEKLKQAMDKIKGMEGQMQKAEEIKNFLKSRKEYLKNELSKLGFAKELKKISKDYYYYGQTIAELKSTLQNYKKIERKAIELLRQSKIFQNFFRKNSLLASLFRLPGSDDPLQSSPGGGSLAGLQTRASVNALIQNQLSSGGPDARQQLQQNLQQAQTQLSELKNKMNKLGKSSSDDEMPEGFKANPEKVKSFLKRLEYSVNIQSQKANGYFPTQSDIGLSIGYKLNERSIIGLGGSYRVGWGQNIRHIRITQQGAAIRSFVDWKIKGSLWLSGGYEMNYRSGFRNVDELKNLNAWTRSGLIGLSKVVSLKTKFFKKTKLQLLWDFLSYQQAPRTQPVLFRVGYNF